MKSTSPQSEVWTTKRLRTWMADYFSSHGIESPQLCAELLLSHVFGCDRLRLYMEADRPASPLERQTLRGLVERAGKHEPIAYLLGTWWFFGLEFRVMPEVLIPRPSTETIVEHILQHRRAEPGFESPVIVDIGTGSGAIAIALAKHIPEAHVIATDISAAALAVAKENATRHEVIERMEFREGSLYEALHPENETGRVDYLISNPPYISDAEWNEVAPNVKDYEPEGALRAGVDGLDDLRLLIAEAHQWLRPGGFLNLEIAASQKAAVLDMANANEHLVEPHVLTDHENLPRVLVARRSE